MVKIIICDDDHFTRKWICEMVETTIQNMAIPAEIVCRSAGANEVLQFMAKNPGDYLFLLDLDLGAKRLGGLDLARELKKEFPLSKIVFVTSHGEKSMEILKSGVEPFGFIEKNMNQRVMIKEFSDVFQKLHTAGEEEGTERKIVLPIGIDEYISLPVRRISYVESLKNKPHHICYHTIDGSQIIVRDTLLHALELLGEDFETSHRSVAVNKRHVTEVGKTQIKLSTGEYVICAIGKRKNFERR